LKRLKVVIILLIISIMFVSCSSEDRYMTNDEGLEIMGIEVAQYPDRLVYIQNVDTKLDLSGGKLNILLKQGNKVLDEMASDQIIIEENVDFTKPGIYIVKLYSHNNGYAEFPVQVISKEELRKMIELK